MHITLVSDSDSATAPLVFAKALIAHQPEGVRITLLDRKAGSIRARLSPSVDLLHVTCEGLWALSAIHAAWHLNLPIIGAFETVPRDGPLTRTRLRIITRLFDRILSSSQLGSSRFLSLPLDPRKLIAWRPGVDGANFSPLRRSQTLRDLWRVSDDRPAVVYAGRLDDDRTARRLISLETALRRSRPMHRLIVVGDGCHRREVEACCRDAVFAGALDDVDFREALASSDVFVWPREDDSPAFAVLEAQASGLPCVVMGNSSAAERVTTGSADTCGSVVDLIVATAALARDRHRRVAMGRAARAHALQQDWDVGLAPIYAGYRSVDAESRARRALGPTLISERRRL